MRRAAPVAAAVALALALAAGCGGGSSSSAGPSPSAPTATPAPLRVALEAPTHRPVVGAPWTYRVRVRDASGRPIPAHVHLQVLFQGVVVGEIGEHRAVGRWRETIRWPAASAGHPLVFRATVTAGGSSVARDYPLTVRPR